MPSAGLATGVEDELHPEAVDARAPVAHGPHRARLRVEVGFEELVPHRRALGQFDARLRRRGSGGGFAGHPGEAEAGHFDDELRRSAAELRGLHGVDDGDRPREILEFQRDAPGEVARVEHEQARLAIDGAREDSLREPRGDGVFDFARRFRMIRDIRTARFDLVFECFQPRHQFQIVFTRRRQHAVQPGEGEGRIEPAAQAVMDRESADGVGPVQVRHAVVEVVGEVVVGAGTAEVVAVLLVAQQLRKAGPLADDIAQFGEAKELGVAGGRGVAGVFEGERRRRILRERLMQVVDEVEERQWVGRAVRLAAERLHRLAIRRGPVHDDRVAGRRERAVERHDHGVGVPGGLQPAGKMRVERRAPARVDGGFDTKQFADGRPGAPEVPELALDGQQRVFAFGECPAGDVHGPGQIREELRLQLGEALRLVRREFFEQLPGREHRQRQSGRQRCGPYCTE